MATRYHVLHPCCRVRQEQFGLLFYDLRGPRLLFAATGDLLDAAAIAAGRAVEEAALQPGAEARSGVTRLVDTLKRRGFVCEQPVC